MKANWMEYAKDWKEYPLAFWVHKGDCLKDWKASKSFDPLAPMPIVGKGYRIICIEVDGYVFRFSSLEQLKHCIKILSRKLLPTTTLLSRERGRGIDPSRHWLSQMPKEFRSWKYRAKATKYLQEVLWKLEREEEC